MPVAAAASKAQEGAVRREDDRELVRRAQLGDKDAFELLVARHQAAFLPSPEAFSATAKTLRTLHSRFS